MARTLDMKFIHYLNLFEKITRIRIQHCFDYNSTIVFVVPPLLISKALGDGGKNVKRLSEILEKRVKVIALPFGKNDMEKFILAIIYTLKIKSIDVKENILIIREY